MWKLYPRCLKTSLKQMDDEVSCSFIEFKRLPHRLPIYNIYIETCIYIYIYILVHYKFIITYIHIYIHVSRFPHQIQTQKLQSEIPLPGRQTRTQPIQLLPELLGWGNTTVDGWNPLPNHLGWCWNPINNGISTTNLNWLGMDFWITNRSWWFFTNPSEKYAQVKLDHFLPGSMKIKNIWKHHLA